MPGEADVTVDGVALNDAQTTALRVGLTMFIVLAPDDGTDPLVTAYKANVCSVLNMLTEAGKKPARIQERREFFAKPIERCCGGCSRGGEGPSCGKPGCEG